MLEITSISLVQTLGVCILSGIISGIVFITTDQINTISDLGSKWFPGFIFGLLFGISHLRKIELAISFSVLSGIIYFIAYEIAYFISYGIAVGIIYLKTLVSKPHPPPEKEVGLFVLFEGIEQFVKLAFMASPLSGLIAGAFGALMLSLIYKLFINVAPNLIDGGTILVGAVSGCILLPVVLQNKNRSFIEFGRAILFFVIWQVSVGLSLRFGISPNSDALILNPNGFVYGLKAFLTSKSVQLVGLIAPVFIIYVKIVRTDMKTNNNKPIESFFKVAGAVGFAADVLAIYQLISVLTRNQTSWPLGKIIGLAAIIMLAFLFAVAFMYFGRGDEKTLTIFGIVYIVYSAVFLFLGGIYAIDGTIVKFGDMLYFIVPSLVVSLFAYFMVVISNTRNELTIVPFVLTSLGHISWYMFRVFSGEEYNTSLTWNVFLIIQFALIFLFYRLAKIQRKKVSVNPDFIDDIDIGVKWNFTLAGKTAYNSLAKMGIFSAVGFSAGLIVGAIFGAVIGLIDGGWDSLWPGIVNGSGIGGVIIGALSGLLGGIAYIEESNDSQKGEHSETRTIKR